MQDVLYSTATGGWMNCISAVRPGNVGIPSVGKTGTTSNRFDIWFCGFTSYYASSVWIGSDFNISVSDESDTAAIYWKKVNKIIHEGLENKPFKSGTDLGLIRVTVDSKSGMLPSSLSYKDPSGKGVITDWFIPGNQPKKVDNNRFAISVCKESGKIATPYCPPSQKELMVYRRRVEEVPAQGRGIPVKDAKEIAPPEILKLLKDSGTETEDEAADLKVEIGSDVDYIEMAKLGIEDPYCYIHTGENRTDEKTSEILAGVKTKNKIGGGKIIKESIIITRHYGEDVNVDAGSEIYDTGVIVTTDGVAIYPWQIKSFVTNPNGPAYNPFDELKIDKKDKQDRSTNDEEDGSANNDDKDEKNNIDGNDDINNEQTENQPDQDNQLEEDENKE